jgi:hypothetical protein
LISRRGQQCHPVFLPFDLFGNTYDHGKSRFTAMRLNKRFGRKSKEDWKNGRSKDGIVE